MIKIKLYNSLHIWDYYGNIIIEIDDDWVWIHAYYRKSTFTVKVSDAFWIEDVEWIMG